MVAGQDDCVQTKEGAGEESEAKTRIRLCGFPVIETDRGIGKVAFPSGVTVQLYLILIIMTITRPEKDSSLEDSVSFAPTKTTPASHSDLYAYILIYEDIYMYLNTCVLTPNEICVSTYQPTRPTERSQAADISSDFHVITIDLGSAQ